MFTLVAFDGSITSQVLLQLTAMPDPHVSIISGNLVVPRDLASIVGLYGKGVDVARVQVQSPSLRQLLQPEVSPLDVNALPTAPSRLQDYRFTPIQVAPDEQVQVNVANAAAGANRISVLMWLADGPIQPISGDVRSVRVTSATTLVANAWTNGVLAFDQTLPAGRYSVVGGRFFGTTLVGFRLVFPGYSWRPGGIGLANATLEESDLSRNGNMGSWGEFNHNTPPTIDFFGTAADTAQTGVLDLLKIA